MHSIDAGYCYSSVIPSVVCVSVGHDREPCKTAELIIWVVSELMRDQGTGLHMGAIWRIRLSDLYSAAMQAIAIITGETAT